MKNNFFTLIELIVVIVVLSILAAIIIPNTSDLREHATIVSLDSDSRNIETAVDMYVLDNNEEYPTEDKTGVLSEEKRTSNELTKKLKVLNTEGEMIEVDTEVVLVSELVDKGHLRNEPKNKKAKFYLIEGGDVIWHLEGVTNSNIIENNDDVISDKELNLTEEDASLLYEYSVKNGFITITKYIGSETDVKIPSKIEGMLVTTLGENSFKGKGLTNVVISNSVTRIENNVFYLNQLTTVVIPDSVIHIGNSVFLSNQLTNVELSNSVTHIGISAFDQNKLTSIKIPDSLTSIGTQAFSRNELTSVEIPDSITTIGNHAFSKNKLTNIDIPNSVTNIGQDAFRENKLRNVEIPNSVTYIGSNAFFYNNLTSIEIPSSVTTIGQNAFSYNADLKNVIDRSGITLHNSSYYYNSNPTITIE